MGIIKRCAVMYLHYMPAFFRVAEKIYRIINAINKDIKKTFLHDIIKHILVERGYVNVRYEIL